jgi:hypothetical protein
VSPNDSKKMAQLTGQRGAEGAALYHRASSSSGLHHGARAAPVKTARHRCGQAAASGAVASCRGALEKRSKRGSAQGGRRVAASALRWERIEGGGNRLGELRSWRHGLCSKESEGEKEK